MRWISILTLLLAAPAGAQLVFDPFFSTQEAITEEAATDFFGAPDTLAGNRLFFVDDVGSEGMIDGGALTCALQGNDDGACGVAYNFLTPVDLTFGGQATGLTIDVQSTSAPALLGVILVDDADQTALGEATVREGAVVVSFANLIALGGVFDFTRVRGLTLGFLTDGGPVTIEADAVRVTGAQAGTLDAARSTTLFDPDRDGEGVQLAILPGNDQVVLTWYTYVDGRQLWLIGSGPIVEGRAELTLFQARGANFGAAFRPEDVVREAWGTASLELLDCNRVLLDAEPVLPGFERQATALGRLLPADCATLAAELPPTGAALSFEHSGTYFDPARDGEGFQLMVEEDGRTVVLTWYTYREGEPVWLIGAGTVSGGRAELAMTITAGADFGPGFDPGDVRREAWGTVVIEATDCNHLEVQAAPTAPGFEALTLLVEKLVPASCR